MGSYGIGIGRLLACVAEHHRDERGLALPAAVAPFDVSLVPIGRGEQARAAAEELYAALGRAGVDALYDDRDVSAGIKFADADLRGMPLRITVSDRSLAAGGAELKRRSDGQTSIVPLEQVVAAIGDHATALSATTNGATILTKWRYTTTEE
jgi:prolyl-tRNA synthetase